MTQAPPTSPLPGEEPLPGVSPAYGVPAGSPDPTTAQEQAQGQADPMTPQATTPGQATFGVPASPVPPLAPPPAAAPGASSGSDAPQDDKAKLLPFYLVCDVSYSMVESGALEECNRILPSLVQALEKDPIICDKVRFGVIDFSDDARVLLPLCDLLEQTSLPNLVGRKNTSYKAAFDLLKAEIERNVTQLKADGYQVHRPAVFFLSDGAPTDPPAEWTASFEALTAYDKASGTGNRMYRRSRGPRTVRDRPGRAGPLPAQGRGCRDGQRESGVRRGAEWPDCPGGRRRRTRRAGPGAARRVPRGGRRQRGCGGRR
ncbi:MAG: hypothetical protein M9891_00735 [Austwickia sp.]|nr:VWA domain-containing protein [Austwickia sp.]MCO5307816.1 hypothetical protein [Austwickia sp.]